MADALDIAGAQVAIRIEEKPADRFAYDFNCKLNPLDWYNQTDEYSAFNCANWRQGSVETMNDERRTMNMERRIHHS